MAGKRMKTKDIFQKWNTFLSEGIHESKVVKNGLLKEITDEEAEAIQGVLDEMDGDVLAFNDLFGGKNRLIIPFATPNETTEVGKFMSFFSSLEDANNLKIDYQTGVITLKMIPSAEQLAAILTQRNYTQREFLKKMKVGKFLASLIKLVREKDKIFDEWGDEGKYEIQSVADKSRKILGRDFSTEGRMREVLSDERSSYAELIKLFIKELEQLAKTWQSKADILKKGGDRTTDVFAIIITRHPVDVLRMSDFDEIQSCHSPPSRDAAEAAGGEYYKCAIAEAHGHGALAYAVRIEDLEEAFEMSLDELEKSDLFQEEEVFLDDERDVGGVVPINRLRLRQIRYYNTDKEAMEAQTSEDGNPTIGGVEVALPEKRVYGMPRIPQFRENVVAWAKQSQKEVIAKIPKAGSSILGSRIVKFGGSYEDNSIKELITDLTGLVVMNYPRQNVKTEDNLEFSFNGREQEFRTALIEAPNFDYFSVGELNFEDGGIFPEIDLTFEWDVEEWDSVPSGYDLRWIPSELSDYGEMFDILKDGIVFVSNTNGKILMGFVINNENLFSAFGWEEAFHDPHDFYQLLRKMAEEEMYGRSIHTLKSIIEGLLKREGYLAGSEFYKLAYESENGQLDPTEWSLEVEGEDPDYYDVQATARLFDIPVGEIDIKIVEKITDSRDFKLAVREEILREPMSEVGTEYFLTSETKVTSVDQYGSNITFDIAVYFLVSESDPKETVLLFRELVEENDDEDILKAAVIRAFKKFYKPNMAVTETKVGISEQKLFNSWRAFLKG